MLDLIDLLGIRRLRVPHGATRVKDLGLAQQTNRKFNADKDENATAANGFHAYTTLSGNRASNSPPRNGDLSSTS